MFNLKKSFTVLSTKVLAGSLALSPVNADACTRVVYLGSNADVISARSMDWNADIGTNLWIFPKGMERSGEAGRNSLRWTSKYGSVIASGFDVATTDGLNEAGLCANLLWLAESQYPAFDRSKPGLSVAAWAQYVLDNFATVQEAVNALRGEPFTIVTDTVPGETRLATLHLSMSDATGDSAIVEYIGGKQVIHHGRKYQVMTITTSNEPNISSTRWRTVADHKRKLYFFESALAPSSLARSPSRRSKTLDIVWR